MKKNANGIQKVPGASPLKAERVSYLVKNKMIASGKLVQAQSDNMKLFRTHRASQNPNIS